MKYEIEVESDENNQRKYFDILVNEIKRSGVISALHIHSYYEIAFFNNPSMQFRFNESESFVLNKYDIIIIYPNTIHGTVSVLPKDAPFMRQHIVKFSPSFLYPINFLCSDIQNLLVPQHFNSSYSVIRNGEPGHSYLHGLLTQSIIEQQEKKQGYEISLRGYLTLIYIYIIRNFAVKSDKNPPAPTEPTVSVHFEIIYKAISYIENHFANDISMDDVAKVCNVNYYFFSRLFRQYTNQKFSAYLLNFRINQARKMLLLSSEPIINIALNCGFKSISYFSMKFQEVTGFTPQNFRRNYTSDSENNAEKNMDS